MEISILIFFLPGRGYQTTTIRLAETNGRLSPWKHVISRREYLRKSFRVVLQFMETLTQQNLIRAPINMFH